MHGALQSSTLAFAALAVLHGGHLLAQNQPERAVDLSANAEPVVLGYGQHTRNGFVSSNTDIDSFHFWGEMGELAWLTCEARTDGLDPHIEVYDPSGALIEDRSCANGCSLRIETMLPADGRYLILVSDVNTDEGGAYSLQLERIPPCHNPRILPYGVSLRDRIDRRVDHDFFVFNGLQDAQLRLNVSATFDGLDPHVQVYDPAGGLLDQGSCANGCSFDLNFTLPTTGDYLVVVWDINWDEGGLYELHLFSIFGGEPAFPASAWTDLGLGTRGTARSYPILAGLGNMQPGTSVGVSLKSGLPDAKSFLLFGTTRIDQFFLGGFLVPDPILILPMTNDPDGAWERSFSWPSGIPSGQTYYCQVWVEDLSGPSGYAASNGIVGITP